MRLEDARWVTDETIHPDVVAHLRGRGLDVLDVRERGWHGRSDDELLEEAHREGRVVLTHDGDFGTLALLGVVRWWASSGFGQVTYGLRSPSKPRSAPRAIALNALTVNIARAVGPALGGVLVAASGPGAAPPAVTHLVAS